MNNSNIIPAIRYRDCQLAIKWLCEVLGFEQFVVYESEGVVHHAELIFDHSLIMVSSYRDAAYDQVIRLPKDIENFNTQSPYIFIDNVKEHHNHVMLKGGDIVIPLTKEAHGSGFTVRDPEGHLWSFGDFNPWTNPDAPIINDE